MKAVILVEPDGVKRFEERDFLRYAIAVKIAKPSDMLVHTYEHFGSYQGEDFESGLLPHKVRDFRTDSAGWIYTSFYANRWVGAMIEETGVANKPFVEMVRVNDIETDQLILAEYGRDKTYTFSTDKSAVKNDDAYIAAPVPMIHPERKSRYELSLDALTERQALLFSRRLVDLLPCSMYSQNGDVSKLERSAFFGSNGTGHMPIKKGSLAERLRETAYAMEHGAPFIYNWTNVAPMSAASGEGEQIAEFNRLVEEFHRVCAEDKFKRGIQTTTQRNLRKKAKILNAMADISGHTKISDPIREA